MTDQEHNNVKKRYDLVIHYTSMMCLNVLQQTSWQTYTLYDIKGDKGKKCNILMLMNGKITNTNITSDVFLPQANFLK